ncbi:radical SAM family heme chaperone HemW [Bacteroidetes/Chlorobi group bacterium ChocPot_Mid]|nr:MAG: radical SAM family heme chaperone HemW [Bacteroidetes/Chlorobi group bacterium ChocPot_Mid]
MAGIYIHIPFCVKKCFYCDFYSIEKLSLQEKFVNYLTKEIKIFSDIHPYNKNIDSVFFGGGTPSLLTAVELELIINSLKNNFNISTNAEWTIESNPGTLTFENLREYLDLGINRISIGVQSFVESELKFLRRIHTSSEAYNSIQEAKKAGFKNLNIDIIFSIPEQTLESLNQTLDAIQELKPQHISAYSLIYEKGTPLFEAYKRNEIQKIDDDTDAELYEFLSKYLIKLGYEHYEVSNFAINGFKCNHNLNYWNGGDYFGFGPSAHSFFNNKRYWNFKSLNKYFEKIDDYQLPVEDSEILSSENILNERIMLGLRAEGLDLNQIGTEFHIDLEKKCNPIIEEWIKNDFAFWKNNKLRLNYKGYSICNTLINNIVNLI